MSGAVQDITVRIKQREAFYCNVKLLLLFLVVYGHMVEGMIERVEALQQIYRIIYSVHMPLFLFLSGLFLKSRKACVRQMRQAFLYYVLCQTVVVAVGRVLGQPFRIGTPVWHLWYLLSLGSMAGLGWCWYALAERCPRLGRGAVKAAVLVLAVTAACTAGKWFAVGRWLSLSRTVCFLPFFLAGMFCPEGMDWKRTKVRLVGLAGLAVWQLLYLGFGGKIPTELFYQADSYRALGIEQGAPLRLMCILLAASLGLFLMTLVPERRLSFSKLGSDTLWIYLLHAPMVKLLELWEMPDHVRVAVSLLFTIFIILFLYKLFQWRRQLYSLSAPKREQPGKGVKTDVRRA